MITILFIVAQFFATLVLLMTVFGNIRLHNIRLTGQILLSMIVSIAFVVLITLISLAHPWIYAFYGVACAGSMLFAMQHDTSTIAYSVLFSLVCVLFWSQMVALMIFNLMFVVPEIDEDHE